jgi:hypothetical protein
MKRTNKIKRSKYCQTKLKMWMYCGCSFSQSRAPQNGRAKELHDGHLPTLNRSACYSVLGDGYSITTTASLASVQLGPPLHYGKNSAMRENASRGLPAPRSASPFLPVPNSAHATLSVHTCTFRYKM